MSEFRQVSESFWASPQIDPGDVDEAKARGFRLIINNRPEGEADDQTPGSSIEAAARAAGLDYLAIPITHAGFSEEQVRAMAAAIDGETALILGYCRSGTRSTLLWSLAQAMKGGDPDTIARQAAAAGYDVGSIRPLIDMLAARGGS